MSMNLQKTLIAVSVAVIAGQAMAAGVTTTASATVLAPVLSDPIVSLSLNNGLATSNGVTLTVTNSSPNVVSLSGFVTPAGSTLAFQDGTPLDIAAFINSLPATAAGNSDDNESDILNKTTGLSVSLTKSQMASIGSISITNNYN